MADAARTFTETEVNEAAKLLLDQPAKLAQIKGIADALIDLATDRSE